MSVQTLDQRLAELRNLRRRIDAEVARVETAIADSLPKVRLPRRPRRSPSEVPPCGTQTAYQRHRYLGETADPACLAAHAADERERSALRRRLAGQTEWKASA